MPNLLEIYKGIFHNICLENESCDNDEELSMKALWRSVITQALMDAASNSKKKSDKTHKVKAIQWLLDDESDFTEVCEMADMEPNYVRCQAKTALNRGCKWRNDQRRMIKVNS